MQNVIEEIQRKYLSGSINLSEDNISDIMLCLFGELTPLGINDFSCSLYSDNDYWCFQTDKSYEINKSKIIEICNNINDFGGDKFTINQEGDIHIGYGERNLWIVIKVKKEYTEIIQSIIEAIWYQFYEYE